jgi:hypothetical protein
MLSLKTLANADVDVDVVVVVVSTVIIMDLRLVALPSRLPNR